MSGRLILIFLFFFSGVLSLPQASLVNLAKCTTWCSRNYPNPAVNCILPAIQGQGPCYVCGPLKTAPSQQLCGGACKDTSNDIKNCGACGHVCPTGASCVSGSCKCTATSTSTTVFCTVGASTYPTCTINFPDEGGDLLCCCGDGSSCCCEVPGRPAPTTTSTIITTTTTSC